MIDIHKILLIYIVLMNVAGFLSMGMDKLKAKHRTWRIPETTLFMIAIFGGSIGSIIGMYLFHHKTRHLSFIIGLPVIIALQIACIIYFLFYSPIQIRFI